MSELLGRALEHLAWLVACDTTNPPRRPAPCVERLGRELGATCRVRVTDHGEGSMSLLAVRGAPRTLFNFHLDTVPVSPGWTRDPFRLAVEGDRAYGLGTCDTKGALAVMLAVAERAPSSLAILVTTDEEAGQATCMRAFCSEPVAFDRVVVAEPTSARAVLAHRGVGTARLTFRGQAGHSSVAGGGERSANHKLVRWAAEALERAARHEREGQSGLSGLRLNLGRITGGEKPNVVSGHAEVDFGVRPPPPLDPRAVVDELAALGGDAMFTPRFFGPPLPAPTPADLEARARAFVDACGLPTGDPVDFWTEASLVSAAGVPAIVLGAGSITEAHAADEHVPLADLEALGHQYLRILAEAP